MKRPILTLALVLLAGLFLGAAYLASQRPKFRCDRCTTQLILLEGGYRTWGVSYCHHAPKFFHFDIRVTYGELKP